MKDGPVIAESAALIGDPARANMLASLMDGRALTVSELAEAAGVALPTASGHLSRLAAAGLVAARSQGRHRYFALTGGDVAQALEALMTLAQRTGAVRTRAGPHDEALRAARICYDHMAGRIGVELLDAARSRGLLAGTDTLALTAKGAGVFAGLGIDADSLAAGRRPLCRTCLDWSERRLHLAGALGAALLARLETLGWVRRETGRVLTFPGDGLAAVRGALAG